MVEKYSEAFDYIKLNKGSLTMEMLNWQEKVDLISNPKSRNLKKMLETPEKIVDMVTENDKFSNLVISEEKKTENFLDSLLSSFVIDSPQSLKNPTKNPN